ncbi:MAG: hypothetical protein F6K18_02240 [Okeania sp. SIO2C2]|uniref:hypothetical protein n=1 Tax=Okeania sp. SIO2C2 TaxID=2607787 RepID=UPI0013BD3E84|nr:hypothetical protein [Okeania sp. SIO2C2]NEP85734.1 hypothetical protein [Okeania sp. SIO2C2]
MLFKQPTFLQYFPFHKITPLATISIFEVALLNQGMKIKTEESQIFVINIV